MRGSDPVYESHHSLSDLECASFESRWQRAGYVLVDAVDSKALMPGQYLKRHHRESLIVPASQSGWEITRRLLRSE